MSLSVLSRLALALACLGLAAQAAPVDLPSLFDQRALSIGCTPLLLLEHGLSRST